MHRVRCRREAAAGEHHRANGRTSGDRGPAGHGDMPRRYPRTQPDAHSVTTRAAGLHRAVRRRFNTGQNTPHGAHQPPLSPPTSQPPRIGGYGRSPLANRSTGQPRRVGRAYCNDRITDCSSRSVIVTCRRPIAKRITELSGHADEQESQPTGWTRRDDARSGGQPPTLRCARCRSGCRGRRPGQPAAR